MSPRFGGPVADIEFKAKVWAPMKGMGWTFARLPKSASKQLGSRARVSVKGTINGFAFRTSAFPDGKGSHSISVNAAMKRGANVGVGQTAAFKIRVDSDPIKVVMPVALRKELAANPKAQARWKGITPKAQAEWIAWIGQAKQEPTRVRRIEKAVERLAKGDKRVYD
jgi:hypothetical protein